MLRALRKEPRATAILMAAALLIPALFVDRLVLPVDYHLPHVDDYTRLWLRITYLLPMITGALAVLVSPQTVTRVLRQRLAWIAPACLAADAAVYVLAGIFEKSFKAAALLPHATVASIGALLTGIVLYEKAPTAIGWVLAATTSISAAVAGFQLAEAFGHSTAVGAWIVRWDEIFSLYTSNPIAWRRAEGLALNPNIFTPLAIVGLLWAVFGPQRGASRWVTIVSSIAIAALGQSRTTMAVVVILAVLAIVAAFMERTERRISKRALALFAIVLVAATLIVGVRTQFATQEGDMNSIEAVEHFVQNPDGDSGVSTRLDMWVATTRAIVRQPLGYFQGFREYVQPYPHPHNEVLFRLLYAGPLWLVVYVVFLGWLALWLRPPGYRWLGPAMAVALFINGLTEALAWMRPYTVLLYAMIGAAMYLVATASDDGSAGESPVE